MRFLSTLLLICAMVSCVTYSRAQSSHVYEDSSILYPGEDTEAPEAVVEQQISTESPATDEVLYEESNYYKDCSMFKRFEIFEPINSFFHLKVEHKYTNRPCYP